MDALETGLGFAPFAIKGHGSTVTHVSPDRDKRKGWPVTPKYYISPLFGIDAFKGEITREQ
jgi:hypothetical protein